VNCASCGTVNDLGRKFCLECGSALTRLCPSCGTPNPAAGKFCGECGAALLASVAAAMIPGPVDEVAARATTAPANPTERRLVSVLFLDLVGFTSLSEKRDIEDVRALLDGYLDAAQSVIVRHGGVVEKFIGDAVMAVWGTPITHARPA